MVVAIAASISGAELETQHAVEVSSALSESWSATWHFRVRTKPNSSGLYQTRTGPIVQYTLTPRTHLLAGYYWTRIQPADRRPWGTIHRVFAGGEREWYRSKNWDFDTRTILERYYSKLDPEYNRFRQRFRLQSLRPIAPYTAIELFLDADGWRSTRYFAGVRAPVVPGVAMDFGYFFEKRRLQQGGDRHMVMTAIYLHRRVHRKDSDR